MASAFKVGVGKQTHMRLWMHAGNFWGRKRERNPPNCSKRKSCITYSSPSMGPQSNGSVLPKIGAEANAASAVLKFSS